MFALSTRRRWIALGLPLLLAALLAVLATLQYRWVGQVSEGERERMRNSLQARAAQFTQDFDRELTRALLTFQLPGPSESGDVGALLAGRHGRWKTSAAFPQLIDSVYYVEKTDGEPRLFKLAAGAESAPLLTRVEWPTPLIRLRDLIRSSDQPVLHPPGLDAIDETIPALVVPMIDLKVTTQGEQIHRVQALGKPDRFILLTLSREAIRQTIFPALASRYFSGEDGFDYHVAVVDRSPGRSVIYQSDDGWNPRESGTADITASLMDVRFEEVRNLALLAAEETGNTLGPSQPIKQFDRFAVTIVRRPRMQEGGDFVSPRMDPAADAADQARWQLVLRHRAGSLDAAVARSRTRNLLLSFGVLVLLASSTALVLVTTARAERLAAQQIEFVAGVSHELRTPVAVICSAAENLADGVVEDGAQVRRYGSLIRVEGRRLADTVERVLEFAGIMAGSGVGQRVAIDATALIALIEEAESTLRPDIRDAGILVETAVPSTLPPILADPVALRSAIQNLMANAVKYGGAGRSIRVTASGVADHQDREGPWRFVDVSVADRGPGIDATDLPHIFEPFYRGRAASLGHVRGTGVGLSVVKRIVEAHGGRVSVINRPEGGSIFTLRIPVAAALAGSSVGSQVHSEVQGSQGGSAVQGFTAS